MNYRIKPSSSAWEMFRNSVFFPKFRGTRHDLILQVSMAIFAKTKHFSVIYHVFSSAEYLQISPKHFHVVQFSPYMSDLNLFKILHQDFENKGFLRCEPFINPMLCISDLQKPVTSEQKHRFNQCRDAIVDQAQYTDLHKYICRTPKSKKNLYAGYDNKPKKAVKRLDMDR